MDFTTRISQKSACIFFPRPAKIFGRSFVGRLLEMACTVNRLSSDSASIKIHQSISAFSGISSVRLSKLLLTYRLKKMKDRSTTSGRVDLELNLEIWISSFKRNTHAYYFQVCTCHVSRQWRVFTLYDLRTNGTAQSCLFFDSVPSSRLSSGNLMVELFSMRQDFEVK